MIETATQIDSNVQATFGRWANRDGVWQAANYFDETTVRVDHSDRRQEYLTVEEWYDRYDWLREHAFSKA